MKSDSIDIEREKPVLSTRNDAIVHQETIARFEKLFHPYACVAGCLASPNLSLLRNLNRVLVGLEKPLATIQLTLKDGAKRDVSVGSNAEGSSRWVKVSGSDDIWSISSWAADWATAEEKKFQKEKAQTKGTPATKS